MKIIQPAILPGFMELLPSEQILFNRIKENIEKSFKLFGFLPIETPLIEKTEILLAKGGGETSKQVYNIESSTKNMSLRFDLTVPLARYVAEHYHELSFPFKRYHIDKVFRGERNQRGRYKEFYQCDIDIIGDEKLDIHNDAEVLATMNQALNSIGLSSIKFHINNRKITNGYLEMLGVEDFTSVLRVIDKKSKVDEDKFKAMLLEYIDENKLVDFMNFIEIDGDNETILEKLTSLDNKNINFTQGLNELKSVYDFARAYGVKDENIMIDLSITRGLDYYTGCVFETFINGYENIGSICSGGRYDDLASNYTNKNLPGIGMSIGLTRLFYQLREANLIDFKSENLDVLILTMGDFYEYAISVANSLRQNGLSTSIYFEDTKFKKKMNYADKINAKYVIIVGEDEVNNNCVTLKDMSNSNQRVVKVSEVTKIICDEDGLIDTDNVGII